MPNHRPGGGGGDSPFTRPGFSVPHCERFIPPGWMAGEGRCWNPMERQKKRAPEDGASGEESAELTQGSGTPEERPGAGEGSAPLKQAAPKRRFDLHRIFSSAEIVLVGKDLGAIWRNKGTRALLMLLPVVLVVLVPLLYSVAISFFAHGGILGNAGTAGCHAPRLGRAWPPPAVDGGFYHVAVPNAFPLCAGHVLRSGSLPGVGGGKKKGVPWRH